MYEWVKWNKLKNQCHRNELFMQYMEPEHFLEWDGDTKVCLFKFSNKEIIFLGYPVMLVSEVMKRQILLPCLLWILSPVKVGWAFGDLKHHISQYILSTWQGYWYGTVANKLHSIKPILGDLQSSFRRCRKD